MQTVEVVHLGTDLFVRVGEVASGADSSFMLHNRSIAALHNNTVVYFFLLFVQFFLQGTLTGNEVWNEAMNQLLR